METRSNRRRTWSLVVLAAACACTAASAWAQEAGGTPVPDTIRFHAPGLMPEGIEYDPGLDLFLVSSLTQPRISMVAGNGTIVPFVVDPELGSTAGIEVDEAGGRLLVAASAGEVFTVGDDGLALNPDVRGRAELFAFDLESGERLMRVGLDDLVEAPDVQFLGNDVAVDAAGDAFVTDSLAQRLYRVRPDGSAEVFLEDERLGGAFLGANGIAAHADGFLLVAVVSGGRLYKVPLDDPTGLTEVELSEPLGIDGLVLADDERAVAVAYQGTDPLAAEQAVVELHSEDGWASATVVGRHPTEGAATTVVMREGEAYYLNTYAFDFDREQYDIVRARFDAD